MSSPTVMASDVFEEIIDENNRLISELLFADRCLSVLREVKAFHDWIANQLRPLLDENQLKSYTKICEDIDEVVAKSSPLRPQPPNSSDDHSDNTFDFIPFKVSVKTEEQIESERPSKKTFTQCESEDGT